MTTHGPGEQRVPVRVATWAVSMAAHALPDGAVRARYHREWVAELYDMETSRQIAHSLRTLSRSWALRGVVISANYQRDDAEFVRVEILRRPLMCRWHVHHPWVVQWAEDGGRYRHCFNCGRDTDDQPGFLLSGRASRR